MTATSPPPKRSGTVPPTGTGEQSNPPEAPTGDGWSTPKLYRSVALSVPGDMPSIAVATADEDDRPVSTWSSTSYHGPRRKRPAGPAPSRPAGAGSPTARASTRTPSRPSGAGSAVEVPAGEVVGRNVGPAPSQARPAEQRSVLANSRTMAIASLVSRITGFARTILIGAVLGAGGLSVGDAYNLANTIPNMIYELLLGGVLTSVIIPVLVRAQQDDRDAGIGYTQRLLSLATVGLAGMTVLVVIAAPWLIDIFDVRAGTRTTTVHLAYLLLPEILFYGLGAMFSAVLNTRHAFGWAAWTPVANNVIVIATSVVFLVVPGPSLLDARTISSTQLLVIGLGTTVGIAAQALLLLGPMRRSGFEWKWRFRAAPHEVGRLAEFRTLALWVLGYVVISQVGVYVVNRVALRHGGVSSSPTRTCCSRCRTGSSASRC